METGRGDGKMGEEREGRRGVPRRDGTPHPSPATPFRDPHNQFKMLVSQLGGKIRNGEELGFQNSRIHPKGVLKTTDIN